VADSIRERIFQAVEAKLNEVTIIKYVTRKKINPLNIPDYPAVFIVPGRDPVTEDINNALLDRELTIFLFLWIKTQSDDIHKHLEAILPYVQQKMSSDNTLGGLIIDLQEEEVGDPIPLNDAQTESGVVLPYQIRYRVNRFNPYSQAA
jgi:hypothetical protein